MAFSPETYALLKAQGGGGGGGSSDVLSIQATPNDGALVLDKTWNEIKNAVASGKICVIYFEDPQDNSFNSAMVNRVFFTGEAYVVVSSIGAEFGTFSPDGYPYTA